MKLTAHISFFDRVSQLDKLLFTKHLAVMIKSGIPLPEALTTLANQTRNHSFQKLLLGMLADIENGQTLTSALAKFPHVFDPLYINLIRIGEESGNLETNLARLADRLRKSYEFRKKVQGAMLYPAIVFCATIIIGFSISIFVLPKLVDFFTALEVELPIHTKILLFVAMVMKSYGWAIAAATIAIFVVFLLLLRVPAIRLLWHRFILRLPVIGPFLENVELALFSQNVGTMMKSGIPIAHILESQYKATTNLVYKQYVHALLKGVERGKSLEATLLAHKYQHIPPLFIKMIGVGEKTGKLDEMLLYLADFFEDETDNTTKNLATTLEPILLLVIGFIVGFVALALISPIYELTGSIRR